VSDRRTVFDGQMFKVVVEQHEQGEREIVDHPGSVTILPVENGHVTLVRQFREPAGKTLVELPAGTLDHDGETPVEAAQRELQEETGLSGGRWSRLAGFYATPGYCTEYTHVFLAEDVEAGDSDPDDDEEIELVRWPVAELEQHLDEVEDGTTLAALLLLLRRR
jgi:8-oxo-dGTP pyrophosphatase MutT (NUDIX family)